MKGPNIAIKDTPFNSIRTDLLHCDNYVTTCILRSAGHISLLCAVCYGTTSGLHHGNPERSAATNPGTMSPTDAIVHERYNRYKEMYTNCTIVNGNIEIVFLIGSGNHMFSLDFLSDIREVRNSRAFSLPVEAAVEWRQNGE